MFIKPEELKIDAYDDAWVVPGGQHILHVYDNEGNFVPFTSKRVLGKEEYSVPETPLKLDGKKCDYFDEEVVYIGLMRGHWGHFIVDSSVRLWALERPECSGKRLLMAIEGLDEIYSKIFEYLNIDKKRIFKPDHTVRFKKILVPELSYFPGHYITKEFLIPFQKVSAAIWLDKPVYDKIYLSRVHFARKKKEFGEKQIQTVFEMNGYHILYPEELSFEEQIWYYKNCKKMVTTGGTISHNVVYADNGIELTILERYEEGHTHQNAINQMKEIKSRCVRAYDRHSDRNNCLMKRTPEFLELCKKDGLILPRESKLEMLYLTLLFRLPYLYRWFKK